MDQIPPNEYRQAIVVNKALGMKTGKVAAQVGHAAIGAYINSNGYDRDCWVADGMTKIVLRVDSDKELRDLAHYLNENCVPHYLVVDYGRTQLPQNTATCVGIGPLHKRDLDKLIGDLRLY